MTVRSGRATGYQSTDIFGDQEVSTLDAGSYDVAYLKRHDDLNLGPGSERTLFGHLYRERLSAVCQATSSLPKGSRIIDLGCAQGDFALRLARNGYMVTAVDVNPLFLDYARTKDVEGRVRWLQGDIFTLALDEQFDAVILAEVLEHAGAPERLIPAVARLVLPGGLLVATTPNATRLREHLPTFTKWAADHPDRASIVFGPAGEHHRYLFTRPELVDLLRPYFSTIGFKPTGSVLVNRWTEWVLGSSPGRRLLTMGQSALLSLPMRPRLANDWVITAIRSSGVEHTVARNPTGQPEVSASTLMLRAGKSEP
jgi:2-polyprenyl-3-methyl-5-hydroxy-6-metoxy-1,4-benzoquinol methylase